MFKLIIITLALACIGNAQKFPINAVATIGGGVLSSNGKDPVLIFGDVKFTQMSATGPVTVNVNITFFPSNDPVITKEHGFHIHTFGIQSVSSIPTTTCDTAGAHWNTGSARHGGLEGVSHDGDLGTVVVSPDTGRIVTQIVTPKLKLFGAESIIGRSVVLHEKADDLGLGDSPLSEKTGNSGARIACGTIGLRP